MGSHFFDGATPKRHDIEPDIGPEGIAFETERGALAWRHEDLIRLWDYRPQEHLAFTHRRHQDSRLIIEEAWAVEAIGRQAPQLLERGRERWRHTGIAAGLSLGVLTLIAGLYFFVPPVTDRLARAMPWSFEAVDRPELDKLALMIGKRCAAEEPNRILRGLVEDLLKTAAFPHPITVDVTSSKMVNALTFAGGRIVLLRGLIDKARSPNELAAVIGHEIGHVVHRDHTERWMRENALSAASVLLFGFDGTNTIGQTVFETGLSLSYSRGSEQDADRYALRLLNRLDLDPAGGAEFFERMRGKGDLSGLLPGYLSTHPDSDGRAVFFREQGTGTKQALSPEDWLILKRICDKTD
ncbi:MAG: M48 family metallopeptidase [Nisaea sp.]|uniref:M48 family metallopeptidase n=1 Tax=Nisaea sp. TaxID=2024842 RepID=UPI001B0A51AA|nr:M48 family metallopeptidase [Nisaea sp.]MBO6562341.1 M48 family metallopeptidase [Nisaea sp.]